MSTPRLHHITTRASRIRLVHTASAMLRELLGDDSIRADITNAAHYLSGRLVERGVTSASPRLLEEHARTADAIDGLETGRYDVGRYVDDTGHAHDTRAALLRGFDANLTLIEDLLVLPA